MRKILLKNLFAALVIFAAGETSAQCTATLNNFGNSTCDGDSVTFQSYPLGADQYEWFVNGASVGTGGSFYWDVLPAGTYTFYVEITENGCMAQSNSITLTLSAAPTISASNNGPICAGSTLQLNAASNGNTYSWWGPYGFSSTQQNPQISNAQIWHSGNYYVTASNGNCSAIAMTSVQVDAAPNVLAYSFTNGACIGDTFSLNSSVSGITNATYSWSGPNSFSSTLPNVLVQNTTLAHAGTYTLTVSGNSCNGPVTMTSSVNIAVANTPVVTVANNGPLCQGSTLQLTGTVSSGTYSWTGPNSFYSTQLGPSITNAQPANSGTYTLTANDNGCIVSVSTNAVVGYTPYIDVFTFVNGVCVNDSFSLNTSVWAITNPTFAWTGPNGFTSTSANPFISSASLAHAGTYTVTISGDACSGPVNMTDNVTVLVANCDSVWPGDANSDFVANYIDVLNVGIGYGTTGAARTGASNNWVGQYCTNWINNFNNAINYKHADCNGDGLIDSLDNNAIFLNYGQTHQKGGYIPAAKVTGFPDLFFDMSGVMLTPGATVTVPIKLGTSSVMMQNMYGIAAQVKIDGITPTTDMIVTGTAGWMGNTANTMSFQHAIGTTQTDWTFVRTDHSNTTGEGVIGSLTFTVPMGTENQMVDLYFENVVIIDNNGDPIQDFNVIDGAATVYPTSVATTGSIINSAVIAPNPSDAYAVLQLTTVQASTVQVSVVDIIGKAVWTATQNTVAGIQEIMLPASDVAPGIYNIVIRDDKGSVAQTLKWVKK